MTDLHAYLIYFRDIAIRASERRSIALEEHWLIFRGMKTKNIDQITLLTHEHLNRSLQFILKEMERRQLNKQDLQSLVQLQVFFIFVRNHLA